MTGYEVKQLILNSNVRIWKVAEAWGLSDGNFSKRLRRNFSEDEVSKIKSIIADIKSAK